METKQLCEEQTENLEVINPYCSIQRVREISRGLPEKLKNLEIGQGFQIIGIPNIFGLREMVSNINSHLKTDQYYEQKINEQNLTYRIVRVE